MNHRSSHKSVARHRWKAAFAVFTLLLSHAIVFFGAGCTKPDEEVVVYTSVDQVYSEPVLERFWSETGIRVRAVYDVEASKTVGLVNRLIAESNNPQADVFWNSEASRTIVLRRRGVLAQYVPHGAASIPSQWKDSEGFWTGFALRSRVLLYNTDLMDGATVPRSMHDLTTESWKGRFAMAYPLFGTTATHMAAITSVLGPDRSRSLFQELANRAIVVDGNSLARDQVVEGVVPLCLTDSDDAAVAIRAGRPVAIAFLDGDQFGIMPIPNTVALVAGSRRPANARRLIDFLVDPRTEAQLIALDAAQVPVRAELRASPIMPPNVQFADVDLEAVTDALEPTVRILREFFTR